jgi:hypothetical protein
VEASENLLLGSFEIEQQRTFVDAARRHAAEVVALENSGSRTEGVSVKAENCHCDAKHRSIGAREPYNFR